MALLEGVQAGLLELHLGLAGVHLLADGLPLVEHADILGLRGPAELREAGLHLLDVQAQLAVRGHRDPQAQHLLLFLLQAAHPLAQLAGILVLAAPFRAC